MTSTSSASINGASNVTPKASKSSFFLGMRILPKNQRQAMYLIYDFCRTVDDIADSKTSKHKRLAELNLWRRQLDEFYNHKKVGELTNRLADVILNFNLKKEDFLAILDGMEMDVIQDNHLYNWRSLDTYCDCVASAVGRLSSKIFGLDEASGKELSHHLGRAFQLTNILRDIDEDASMGRFYMPSEELERNNILSKNIHEIISDASFSMVCDTIALKAKVHFDEAEKIMKNMPRARVKSPRIMCAAYKALFQKLNKRGWVEPRQKISTPKSKILFAILKYGFI